MSLLNDVCIFDFETTGFDFAGNDRVIEMAAVRIRGGHVISEFSTLVCQPEFSTGLPEKITELTGITTEMMRAGMDEKTAFQILNRMMIGSTLVAHNAAFDLAYLHFSLQRLAGRTFSHSFLDTLTIARDRHFYPHKLTDMTARYGIELNGAHRALNDVYGCYELLREMHAEQPVDEWVNTLAYLPKYGPPKWAPEYAKLVPMENKYESRGATSA
jgi:DNA polymerase III subunit epsilon